MFNISPVFRLKLDTLPAPWPDSRTEKIVAAPADLLSKATGDDPTSDSSEHERDDGWP